MSNRSADGARAGDREIARHRRDALPPDGVASRSMSGSLAMLASSRVGEFTDAGLRLTFAGMPSVGTCVDAVSGHRDDCASASRWTPSSVDSPAIGVLQTYRVALSRCAVEHASRRLRLVAAPVGGALFSSYDLDGAYDEMFDAGGEPRAHCRALFDELRAASPPSWASARSEADKAFLHPGHHLHRLRRRRRAPSASFRTTCCRASSPAAEWRRLERGLTQRLTASTCS